MLKFVHYFEHFISIVRHALRTFLHPKDVTSTGWEMTALVCYLEDSPLLHFEAQDCHIP